MEVENYDTHYIFQINICDIYMLEKLHSNQIVGPDSNSCCVDPQH